MKVIGTTAPARQYGPPAFICVIDMDELRKVFDNCHGSRRDDFKEPKPGDELDLGNGYNFREDIKGACRGMVDAMERFERARQTMLKFSVFVAGLHGIEEAPKP